MSAAASLSAGPSPPSSLPGCYTGSLQSPAQSTVFILQRVPGSNVCQAARAGPQAEEAAGAGKGRGGKGSRKGSWLALGTAPPQRDLVCQTLTPRRRPVPPPRLSWLLRAVGSTATREPGGRANFWNQTDWVEFWNGHLLFNRRLLYKSPSAPCLSTSVSAGA